MTDIKYPIAKLHKFLHAAPQFRPIRRGARRKGIERTYISKDGSRSLTMTLFHELDIADQDLLLCLISILMVTGKSTIVSTNPKQELNILLRAKLNLNGDEVVGMSTIAARSTAYEILTELGRVPGKSGYVWLENSLDRLAGVSFKFRSNKVIESFHLMSWSARFDEKSRLESISFCINPYSAGVVLGDKGGYVLLHRSERAQLNSEEAKALHSVLCGLVDMGTEDRVLGVDMLADRIYSRYEEIITSKAMRSRRSSIIRAGMEIDVLNYWTCLAIGKGADSALKITRKRREVLA
jgi:hypothetical protein